MSDEQFLSILAVALLAPFASIWLRIVAGMALGVAVVLLVIWR